MTTRQITIILSSVLIVLIVFVYYFSTPSRPTHFMPVGTDGSIKATPVIDSTAQADTSISR